MNLRHGVVGVTEHMLSTVTWIGGLKHYGDGICYFNGPEEEHPAYLNTLVDLDLHARKVEEKKQAALEAKKKANDEKKRQREKDAEERAEEWEQKHAKYLYDKENVACQEKTRHGSKRSYNEMQDDAKEGDE